VKRHQKRLRAVKRQIPMCTCMCGNTCFSSYVFFLCNQTRCPHYCTVCIWMCERTYTCMHTYVWCDTFALSTAPCAYVCVNRLIPMCLCSYVFMYVWQDQLPSLLPWVSSHIHIHIWVNIPTHTYESLVERARRRIHTCVYCTVCVRTYARTKICLSHAHMYVWKDVFIFVFVRVISPLALSTAPWAYVCVKKRIHTCNMCVTSPVALTAALGLVTYTYTHMNKSSYTHIWVCCREGKETYSYACMDL